MRGLSETVQGWIERDGRVLEILQQIKGILEEYPSHGLQIVNGYINTFEQIQRHNRDLLPKMQETDDIIAVCRNDQ